MPTLHVYWLSATRTKELKAASCLVRSMPSFLQYFFSCPHVFVGLPRFSLSIVSLYLILKSMIYRYLPTATSFSIFFPRCDWKMHTRYNIQVTAATPCFPTSSLNMTHQMRLKTRGLPYFSVCVCVCVYLSSCTQPRNPALSSKSFYVCARVFIKLHITAQSGPVTLVILCHSH